MNEKGELVPYPGGNEEMGYISVTPEQIGSGKDKYFPLMMNLNGQGGDLRLEGHNLRLFGDGDGYQFTDLVIWEPDAEDGNKLEGYVHDYGSTYGGAETFKQFIKCKRSEKQL